MILKDGKFWQDGKVVPIEHGNKEQIKLMTKRLELITALSTDGICASPDITTVDKINFSFNCVCGVIVKFPEKEFPEMEYDGSEVIGLETKCKCGKKYIIDTSEDEVLVIKFKK